LDWMRLQAEQGQLISSYYTAMIEAPKPWTGLREGGFHSPRFKQKFIKTSVNDNYFSWDKMQNTVKAVNAIQATPWRINREILQVVSYVYDKNLGWGGLPKAIDLEEIPYPFPDMKREDMNEEQLAKVRQWAYYMHKQHDLKISEGSKYLSLVRVLSEAKRFAP